MSDIPKLSERTDLTLLQAKAEYIYLVNFPRPEHGFANWLEVRIVDRMAYLQKIITNFICFNNGDTKNE